MNRLKVNLQHSIATLAAQGWSRRRIARTLRVNRETVGKYLRPDSNPAISTSGSEGPPDSKPAISTPGSGTGRLSLCLPWQVQIEGALAVGLSAQRIYQDLVGDHGFGGSYQAVKRFVRRLRQSHPKVFERIEVEPGAEAQVDFGQGAWVEEAGRRRRPHLFRVVLSHSRKGYSEVVWQQTTENFIRCVENAFRHFGGVPQTLVIDNLRAAVRRTDWFEPDLNPKVQDFCQHYGTVILPTRPAKQLPKHSGEYLLEVVMRRYENRSTIMTSNRPLEEWGKLLSDVPTAGAILDRFLHHAQVIAITGRSYRVKDVATLAHGGKKQRKSSESPTAGAAS